MLKSIFVSIFPILCLVGVVISIDQYIHGYLFASIGLAMTSIPLLFLFGKLFLTDVPRTSPNLNIYSGIVGLGLLFLIYAFYSNEAESMASIGFLLTICWFLYVKWYSVFGDRTNNLLSKGQALPSLKFEDETGNVVTSDSFLGKKNILMFYRGNWCPLCMAQIKELSNEYRNLEALGIQTVLISPQPHTNTMSLAKKYDVGFRFLVDKNNSAAEQLNIASKNGLPAGMQVLGYDSDTVMPTIILTDEKGKIIHSDLTSNYRVRPEPAELIKYFES